MLRAKQKFPIKSNRFEYDNLGFANGAAGIFFIIWLVVIVVVVAVSLIQTHSQQIQSVSTIGADQRKANVHNTL